MSLDCAIKPQTRYDYAIGDIQGCYDGLMALLDKIDFDDKLDRLWFVGDLVNRGPSSLAVLKFLKNIPLKPYITLGNHDLHLIRLIYLKHKKPREQDTISCILQSDTSYEIGEWLRKQPILHYDEKL